MRLRTNSPNDRILLFGVHLARIFRNIAYPLTKQLLKLLAVRDQFIFVRVLGIVTNAGVLEQSGTFSLA